MVASMRMERDPVQNKQPKPVSASGPDGRPPPSPALMEDAWRFISPAVEPGEEEEGAGVARLRRAGPRCHDGPDPPRPGGTASGRGTGWGQEFYVLTLCGPRVQHRGQGPELPVWWELSPRTFWLSGCYVDAGQRGTVDLRASSKPSVLTPHQRRGW